VCHKYGSRWHEIHTNLHDGQFKDSSNIKGINSINSEAIVLVLLMRGNYSLCNWDTSCGKTYTNH
jgi:hypothetical protein